MRALAQKALAQKITVTGPDGRPRRVTKGEVLMTNLANRAIKGDSRAVEQVFRLLHVPAPVSRSAHEAAQSAGKAGISGGSEGPSLSPDVLLAVARMLADAPPEALGELLAQGDLAEVEQEPAAFPERAKTRAKTPAHPPAKGEDA
jgi:hypothetical protein